MPGLYAIVAQLYGSSGNVCTVAPSLRLRQPAVTAIQQGELPLPSLPRRTKQKRQSISPPHKNKKKKAEKDPKHKIPKTLCKTTTTNQKEKPK